MKRPHLKILKLIYKNNGIIKNYYKNIILKSFIQNYNINNLNKISYTLFFKKSRIINNNICLIDSIKSNNKKINLSKYNINKLSISNLLTNFKNTSW